MPTMEPGSGDTLVRAGDPVEAALEIGDVIGAVEVPAPALERGAEHGQDYVPIPPRRFDLSDENRKAPEIVWTSGTRQRWVESSANRSPNFPVTGKNTGNYLEFSLFLQPMSPLTHAERGFVDHRQENNRDLSGISAQEKKSPADRKSQRSQCGRSFW